MEQVSDFQRVYDFGNLYAAFLKARKGKRGKPSVAKFEANLLEALSLLSELLKNKTYTMSQYFVFKVYEPKERVVMTNAFKDKVVQHSLCDNVLEPAFSKSFIRDNYASQRGRGTHDGLYRLEEFMRSYYFSRKAQAERESREEGLPRLSPAEYADGWVLKCDVSKYFYSIRHEPLKRMVRRFITDPDVLWLIDLIIDSTPDPGIPIGNQTSQWFAVMYLSGLDHFIKEKLKIKYYGRYMDDFFLIHEDKAYLQYCKKEIEKYVAGLGLSLNNKTNIFPLRNGIDFLGFHTYLTETGKVIRKVRRSSKGILWGWTGDASKTYGGAKYTSNGVPDIGADSMIRVCKDVSTDFGKIIPGEAVWLSGHIGVYIGGGKVIECSPAFLNRVQVTACLNIGKIAGMNGRKWTKHGRLPYITYDMTEETTAGSATKPAGRPGTSGGSSDTSAPLAFSVGDVVRFTGSKHYTSANAATGPACKPGTARVIGTYKGKHPYQLKAEPGGGSTVYGWVDAADVQAVGGTSAGSGAAAKMRVGARVRYSGPLFRDSNGNGQGKTVNGAFTVKYYYPGRKCGVHIDGLGWVPESACSVIG